MIELLFALVVWLTPTREAAALERTAPSYLDLDQARDHLAAARIAGAVHHLPPELILAIAWRESRYQHAAVTPESAGRMSCGAMTPTPVARCVPQTLLEDYLAGAAHLRHWVNATRSLQLGLQGYAGGYRMIRACERGPVVRVRARVEIDLCSTPELRRAAWIRREIERAVPSPLT